MIALTPGQVGDCPQAEPLLEAVVAACSTDDPGLAAVLGDKSYDSDALIAYIEGLEAEAVIPARKNRTTPREIDRNLYKDRNKIERFIGRIKHYRRIATRYEKTARNYLALLHLVGAMVWLL